MKTTSEQRYIETDGMAGQSTGFKIKANAKAFKILTSNLYTDVPLAIVRELGCNAYDAHIAASKSASEGEGGAGQQEKVVF